MSNACTMVNSCILKAVYLLLFLVIYYNYIAILFLQRIYVTNFSIYYDDIM